MKYFWYYIVFIFPIVAASCSAEKNALMNRAFHNTTSHYNPYFYAKDHLRNVQNTIESTIVYDYDRILPIFPTIDTSLANSYKSETDEAIKMASIAIQRHANSKWVDDSYLLVGLSRLYSLDYVNAILTFKYINKNSPDDDVRHHALVLLYKTFIDYEEYDNAVEVSDFLKKEKLNPENLKELYLYRGYFYQIRKDLDNMLTNLLEAVPLLSNNDGKGRIYFIVGQNYQELGFDAEAYNYYKKCLSTNPEYELDFYTRLRMAQVTQINENSDVRTVRRYLLKLLKDKKNKEFKDKIYYEMAEFEGRQGNLDIAIEHYNSSIRASTRNQRQKGLAYWKLGQIYYDTLKEFRLAEAYYDSTISVLPKDYEGYEKIQTRHKILSDFVTQLNTIELQDSLLTLSNMDTSELRNYFTEYVEAKNKEREKELEKKSYQTTETSNIFDDPVSTGTSNWYFGNPSALAMGQTEFQRIWGDIELADNWRRAIKDIEIASNDGKVGPTENTGGADTGSPAAVLSEEASVDELMGTVPQTAKEKSEAHSKIEKAYYRLGNIYHFDLLESINAAETFETLLTRYDTTHYKPEVMYLLYLIYKDAGDDKYLVYKDRVLNEFGESIYAKLILNPNYSEESSQASVKLKIKYKEAYDYYSKGDFPAARVIIRESLSEYDDLPISANFKLLEVLIIGKTENIAKYQYELSAFIEKNQESDLAPYAQTLLEASRDFEDRSVKAKGIRYVEYFEQEHFFVVVYESKNKELTKLLTTSLDTLNNKYFGELGLNTTNLVLDETSNITMVSEFKGAKSSLQYYEQFMLDPDIKSALPLNDLHVFTITTDNFKIFYKTKELKGYLKFFSAHYQ